MVDLEVIIESIKNGLSTDDKLNLGAMISSLGGRASEYLIMACGNKQKAVQELKKYAFILKLFGDATLAVQLLRKVGFCSEKVKKQIQAEEFKKLISKPQKYSVNNTVPETENKPFKVSFGKRQGTNRDAIAINDIWFDVPDDDFNLNLDTANAIVHAFN